jgi:hypothetical protein
MTQRQLQALCGIKITTGKAEMMSVWSVRYRLYV